MTKEQIVHNHLGKVILEIAKVDTIISETNDIPVDQLFKHMERRQKLGELCNYLKFILVQDKEPQKPQEEGRILTMQ